MQSKFKTCGNFTVLEQETDHSVLVGELFKLCVYCDNFRSNCGKDTCTECANVPYDFYCAIDKQEI